MRKSKGFSAIELLLVLGIIATLCVAAFVIYPRVAQARQQNMAQNDQTSPKEEIPVVGKEDEQNKFRSTKGF